MLVTHGNIFFTGIVLSEVINCTYLCCDEDNVMLVFMEEIWLVIGLKINNRLTA